LSEEETGLTRGFITRWVEYEHMRKESEDLLRELEFTNFNSRYGIKTESEFRAKLQQIITLLAKIESLIGPPPKEATLVA
jgi:hypothetical protein